MRVTKGTLTCFQPNGVSKGLVILLFYRQILKEESGVFGAQNLLRDTHRNTTEPPPRQYQTLMSSTKKKDLRNWVPQKDEEETQDHLSTNIEK